MKIYGVIICKINIYLFEYKGKIIMGYPKRQLVKIIEEVCQANKIKLNTFSDNWILQLTTEDEKQCYIYGYKFPNNNAAISNACDDKCALADILKENKIPCVERFYFERPSSPMMSEEGIWSNLLGMLDKYGKLVCQTNSGSGGSNVFKCESKKDLEMAVFDILKSHRNMCVSPLEKIQNEYRIIVEGDEAMLIYNKQRPNVIGDGMHTLGELIEGTKFNKDVDIIPTLDLQRIPKNGERVTVSWKHNLGQGSLPELIADEETMYKLANFALTTAKRLGLNFASIDIIRNEFDKLKILEINSGVMMETFSALNPDNYDMSKHIYEKAILDYFGMENNSKKNIYQEISHIVPTDRIL